MKAARCPQQEDRVRRRVSQQELAEQSRRETAVSRRLVFKATAASAVLSCFRPLMRIAEAGRPQFSSLFFVTDIPVNPFRRRRPGRNRHVGVECLLDLMGGEKVKFYRSRRRSRLGGRKGLIAPDDVVLIKVNAQWKYRGCTNSDVVRGLIQRVLEHPDGFAGEVVLIENGQDWGSFRCDTGHQYGNSEVHANANERSHSFTYLVESIFQDPRVSSYLLDRIGRRWIDQDDHEIDGYRRFEDVSYPCFTTAAGHRVELREGIWNGTGYSQNLKLINVPVLKHHGGAFLTAALKNTYGILSMKDGHSDFRHYSGLGQTCAKMIVSVRPPVLNIIDAIWVSHYSLEGYPPGTTTRMNQLLAGQDPVALDYWAAKYILHPIDGAEYHDPDIPEIRVWLDDAAEVINGRGGLWRPREGLRAGKVRRGEEQMLVHSADASQFLEERRSARIDSRS